MLSLLEERPLNKVTVNSLCETSSYSRSAFYASFYDKYELAQRIVDDEIDALVDMAIEAYDVLGSEKYISESRTPPLFIERMIQRVDENRTLYRCIFGDMLVTDTENQLVSGIAKGLSEHFIYQYEDHPLFAAYDEFIIRSTYARIISLVKCWVLNDFDLEHDDLILLYTTVTRGIGFENIGKQDGKQIVRFVPEAEMPTWKH